MNDPFEMSVKEALDRMSGKGLIPIGFISYDTKKKTVVVSVFRTVDPQEALAILQEAGLKGSIE